MFRDCPYSVSNAFLRHIRSVRVDSRVSVWVETVCCVVCATCCVLCTGAAQGGFVIHVTVHRVKFLIIKLTRFLKLILGMGSSSVHHQEFFTVHTTAGALGWRSG